MLTTLERAVLKGTPQDAADICKGLPKDAKWERAAALALACRLRGLEYVKALVDNGASIGKNLCYLLFALLDINRAARIFVEDRMSQNKHLFADNIDISDTNGAQKSFKLLPANKRAEIARYLCENSKRVCFDPSKLLLYSIMSNDKKVTAALKEMGVGFSLKLISALTEDRRKAGWREYYMIQCLLDDDEFFDILQSIVKEIGDKKLHFSGGILGCNDPFRHNRRYYSDPLKFGFILEHFNQKQMNKMTVMRTATFNDSAACLEICIKHGWLTKPGDRDELIEYAAEENKTECLAFLLDYKKRNFDLAAEREKAEKKALRKLNASPDSVTALREQFRWKKQEDGTLIITEYIGTGTAVKVPERIGRSTVTAIGDFAFSIELYVKALRFMDYKAPWFKARRYLSKVVLPDSIRSIGNNAFAHCIKLKDINIPDGLVHIGHSAFVCCEALTEVIIPDTVREMGNYAFSDCYSLQTVKLSEGMCEIPLHIFRGCKTLKRIVLPGGIQRIDTLAFTECEALEEIVIPASVTMIRTFAFDKCEKVTAVVEPNSYAEEYCKQNNIPFRYGDITPH